MKSRGVAFQDTIDAYYDLIDKRLPLHGESLDALRELRILIDGTTDEGTSRSEGEPRASGSCRSPELLLQIFTQTVIGPIFFEIIQRKGDEGFGEGNFRALFESIELDQIRRGVLKPGDTKAPA
jgi:4-hydroxyphenylpyruvate dioxygenase